MVTQIDISKKINNLRFWSIDDPYLYDVYVNLIADDEVKDSVKITTGFRKVEYDKSKGLLINEKRIFLRVYAQRSANEWAAIDVCPNCLRDMDAKSIRESNANHIDGCGGRYMGCRSLSREDVVNEAEYVGTMLNRHAGRFESEKIQWNLL